MRRTGVRAHTGHALILLMRNGDVMGTGGNIYGPVGRHGLGDKAVQLGPDLLSGARAVLRPGSSHSLAIRRDGTLMAWGAGYGPDPVAVMENVSAVAAGSSATIALHAGRGPSLAVGARPSHARRKADPAALGR